MCEFILTLTLPRKDECERMLNYVFNLNFPNHLGKQLSKLSLVSNYAVYFFEYFYIFFFQIKTLFGAVWDQSVHSEL